MFEWRFRLNYILWIQDLLDSTGNLENDEFEPTREVVGLDVYGCSRFFFSESYENLAELHVIGVLVRVVYTHSLGARYEIIGSLLLQVCVFGCSGCLASGCTFLADELDIDGKSLECARENIQRNREKVGDLDERITVFDNSPDDDIFPVEKLGIEKHYFPLSASK